MLYWIPVVSSKTCIQKENNGQYRYPLSYSSINYYVFTITMILFIIDTSTISQWLKAFTLVIILQYFSKIQSLLNIYVLYEYSVMCSSSSKMCKGIEYVDSWSSIL